MRRVLYRDALMLVIDKPAGLPVHPGPRNAASRGAGDADVTLTQFLPALRFGLPRVPELAHRLDRDTSGCLVLGRHRKALERLGKLFAGSAAHKTYWAIVEGGPQADAGEIDLPLGRRDPDRGWWMKVDPQGQPALTRWRVLGRAQGRTWLALEPVTGRTHQLRVHCAASGFPILGDAVYGNAPRSGGPGLHLHARAITLPLYPRRAPIHVEAPLPAHMAQTFAALGFNAPAPSGGEQLPPVVGGDGDGQELAGGG
ncbi:MAG: RluA family pseudouridine synthase [Pseudochelatococcus sp.]|uniref:RluA family pseudouridine synthase n=1 Tax=Pseudochelatococcus sp. TaxID=2020869 RepID=UPI003D8D9370